MPKGRRSKRIYKKVSKIEKIKRMLHCGDLVYMPCKYVTNLVGANFTGTLDGYQNLTAFLTASNDWSPRLASFKRFFIKSIHIKMTPTSYGSQGVIAVGFNPNGAALPGSVGVVTDLKKHRMFPLSREASLGLKDEITIAGTSNVLTPITSQIDGQIQYYSAGYTAQANVVLLFMEFTFHTYFSYQA